ncbi:gluconate 2-dehydrogenase subunit 3 family protein [Paraglaciecola arctica]|uniref:gluconate 2-dehydrogenase subunit 3 family protein n=1 Tax=Paraglaciecola arctica TaxID=1128911 RepID=UPI001C07B9E6|nr:gluconate 2-dehydrogenase subunit 3 family protein [Paraglaciecola arctica]MBU3005364.1 gluconate 2-dehydrogenase subunit 3 family protein [Paraglaciecola arctica]
MSCDLSRRSFLKGLGGVVGTSSAAAILSGNAVSVALAFEPIKGGTEKGALFNKQQMMMLKAICATIIPATETPGAADVDTQGFIDNQLFHCYTGSLQNEVFQLLINIDSEAKAMFDVDFVELSDKEQLELLEQVEIGSNTLLLNNRDKFKFLKSLVCFGYYTSEAGASQELRYLAIPGGYKGSVPYSKGDSGWGSMGLKY